MPCPASGPISIQSLKNEFIIYTAPSLSLNEFYRGGGFVPDIPINASVPTSGTVSLSNFYGSCNSMLTYFSSSNNLTLPTATYFYGDPMVFAGKYMCQSNGQILTSSNTTTWTAATLPTGFSSLMQHPRVINGNLYFCGSPLGNSLHPSVIWTSNLTSFSTLICTSLNNTFAVDIATDGTRWVVIVGVSGGGSLVYYNQAGGTTPSTVCSGWSTSANSGPFPVTVPASPVNPNLNVLIRGTTNFVIGGTKGVLWYSALGRVWTNATVPAQFTSSYSITQMALYNGVFIAVATNPSGNTLVMRSTTGSSWTLQANVSRSIIASGLGLAWGGAGNGMWVISDGENNSYQNNGNFLASIDNGVTWYDSFSPFDYATFDIERFYLGPIWYWNTGPGYWLTWYQDVVGPGGHNLAFTELNTGNS